MLLERSRPALTRLAANRGIGAEAQQDMAGALPLDMGNSPLKTHLWRLAMQRSATNRAMTCAAAPVSGRAASMLSCETLWPTINRSAGCVRRFRFMLELSAPERS